MGTHPLRQYYDHDLDVVLDGLGNAIDAWRRHRRRFVGELEALTNEQWARTTRCTEWDATDVINHLATADSFWVLSLDAARKGQPPTMYLRGFDPSTGPDAIIAPLKARPPAEVLANFAAGTDVLVEAVEAFTETEWLNRAESPFGHVPATVVFGHAFWDSWLHERDILLPLGIEPPVEADEVRACVGFNLFFGAFQGGLLGDPAPVPPGPDAPIDVSVQFDELPGALFRVQVDRGVRVTAATGEARPAGSAVALVEVMTGRRPGATFDPQLPPDLVAQLERSATKL